uniref:DUF2232 domain-containing protein n=1 Tax=Candidatus Kentrum sp. LPFa TaxID=2126335 RepID=A0A450XFD1_9GAMM|nr:MAG: hypothetical protein BECKLPF1236A_GA0070988_100609 [Candidatus Kentron sp. LPFa]VFK27949.1 MAG: hypothetical protein BECKLPF1236C_GA0070990_1005510 [Candidatus Kentron sp. LPFa]
MHAFLSRIMQVRSQAIMMAALSLMLPLFGFIGGAIMGLATLRSGLIEGALVAGAATLLAGAATWFFMGTPVPVIAFIIVTGMPILLLAATLRYTRSLGTTITVAGICAAIGVIGLHAIIDDPFAWWRDLLYAMLIRSDQASVLDAQTTERLERFADALAPMVTALPAGIMFGAILLLFLARWWHAILDNPGGFRDEFHALRLDPRLAIAVFLIGGILALASPMAGIGNGFWEIFRILYLFQGLAVFHGIVSARGMSGNWLGGLYLLLVFDLLGLMPGTMTTLLAATGLMDTWLDFRVRVMNKQRTHKP